MVEISGGAIHSLVLTSKNRVLSTGFGGNHALGHSHCDTIKTFFPIEAIREILLRYQTKGYKKVSVSRIACGLSHSTCLINDDAYVWGRVIADLQSPEGCFRQPTKVLARVRDVACGEHLTLMISHKGAVFAMGSNEKG